MCKKACAFQTNVVECLEQYTFFDFDEQIRTKWKTAIAVAGRSATMPFMLCICFCAPPSLNLNETPNRSETSFSELDKSETNVFRQNLTSNLLKRSRGTYWWKSQTHTHSKVSRLISLASSYLLCSGKVTTVNHKSTQETDNTHEQIV